MDRGWGRPVNGKTAWSEICQGRANTVDYTTSHQIFQGIVNAKKLGCRDRIPPFP